MGVGAILKQCVFCPWGGIVTLLYIKSTWLIRRYVLVAGKQTVFERD